MKFGNVSNQFFAWFAQRRREALDAAYEGALKIHQLEERFDGRKIADSSDQSKTVSDYAASLRDRQLLKIRFNLAQLKISSFLFGEQVLDRHPTATAGSSASEVEAQQQQQQTFEKLKSIESIIAKYRADGNPLTFSSTTNIETTATSPESIAGRNRTLDLPTLEANRDRPRDSLFPRLQLSINKSDIDQEQQVVEKLRLERKQNRITKRWIAILLIVPLLVQISTKHLVFDPLLGSYSDRNPEEIELTKEIQENLALEYSLVKQDLEVVSLLSNHGEMNDETRREYLREAVLEQWREGREEALNGLKNLLADLVAILALVGLVLIGRKQVALIGTVSNRSFLNLPDPLKVFIFILITDMFVGFHSAEGWEVILGGAAHHFGLPESPVFISSFIATVPVVIDSCIKLWIFSYLTSYSPTASAIHERMNT